MVLHVPRASARLLNLRTPAKINTRLFVLEARDDGYHELRLNFIPISLCDRLAVRCQPGRGIRWLQSGASLPIDPSGNLAYRAACAFQAATSTQGQIVVHLHKRIPWGAGLGGGSSNAAAVLRSLNRLHDHPLSPAELHRLALQLGSDVPFFLDPRPSWGLGRGEKLTPMPSIPSLPLLIVWPGLASSTAEAFAHLRLSSRPAHRRASRLAHTPSRALSWRTDAPKTPPEDWLQPNNDLEAPLQGAHPVLDELRKALNTHCPEATVGMSGSGSAYFALFARNHERDQALQRWLSAGMPTSWRVFACHTLSGSDESHRRMAGLLL